MELKKAFSIVKAEMLQFIWDIGGTSGKNNNLV